MASAGGDWKDFYAAAECGDAACVRYYLSCGVDVNYQHPEVMQSALIVSVQQGHADIAQLLLEHGASPNLPAELGNITALKIAQNNADTTMVDLLLAYGAQAAPMQRSFWQRWLPL